LIELAVGCIKESWMVEILYCMVNHVLYHNYFYVIGLFKRVQNVYKYPLRLHQQYQWITLISLEDAYATAQLTYKNGYHVLHIRLRHQTIFIHEFS